MKASAGAASRMDELVTVPDIRHWVRSRRREGRRIALVPTMGYLHEGHLRLVDEARRRADVVVMTIFVNPLQFAPGEDLTRYPRDLAQDRRLARERGVDALFVPSEGVMYPVSPEIRIVPGSTAERWEGAARPGHFAGVLTVVAKLFHIVEPDVACFGRKDVQQSVLIRQMVRELDWPIELVVVPTVREKDGLALSSRNAYLDAEQRQRAVALSGALREAHLAWRGGERSAALLEARIRRFLGTVPDIQVEYVAVAEPEALAPVTEARGDTVVAIAARIGATRLIDNIVLDEGV
ncbi:MAG TPA: pantoate--beta-alanine ligase [Gemmatimonadales bacterium]|nr:pantoate--beta-alanine ligase [Gemmatimonadales bacterium]